MSEIKQEQTIEEERKILFALLESGHTQAKAREIMGISINKFYKLYRSDQENLRIQNYRKQYIRKYDRSRTTREKCRKQEQANKLPEKELTKKYETLINKVRAYQNRLYKTNDFTWKDVLAKFEKEPYCYLSGTLIDIFDSKDYNLDHIIPVCRGGESTLDNLAFVKPIPNMLKGTRRPDRFIQMCKVIADYQRDKEQNETVDYCI